LGVRKAKKKLFNCDAGDHSCDIELEKDLEDEDLDWSTDPSMCERDSKEDY
jgi:hypothetical protein